MKKKLLICGSSIAIVVLVLASFSPIVGYKSVETNVKNSPLFIVRSKRAINEESETLICNYLKKGQLMPFPPRNNKIETVLNVIDSIAKMDDETFEEFIVSFVDYIEKDNRFTDFSPDEIRETLYLLRDSDKLIPIFNARTENEYRTIATCTPDCQTFFPTGCPNTSCGGVKGLLGCILLLLLLPFILLKWFIDWCFGGGVGNSYVLSLCCEPKTLRKLF